MKRIFRVYFNQINQERYEVFGTSHEEAITKATAKWKRDYREPSLMSVEDSVPPATPAEGARDGEK